MLGFSGRARHRRRGAGRQATATAAPSRVGDALGERSKWPPGRDCLLATIRVSHVRALLAIVARAAAAVRSRRGRRSDRRASAARRAGSRHCLRAGPGLRAPGAWDGFELAVRAVLGQQITVAAARGASLGSWSRGAGTRVTAPTSPVTSSSRASFRRRRSSPRPISPGSACREARIHALQALARAVVGRRQAARADRRLRRTIERLRALPGFGAWTAQYWALRALRDSDAFPAGDVALLRSPAVANGTPLSPQGVARARRGMAAVARVRRAASVDGRSGLEERRWLNAAVFLIDRMKTPLGTAVLIADERGRYACTSGKTRRKPGGGGSVVIMATLGSSLQRDPFGHAAALERYFAGDIAALDAISVAFAGTPFQTKVWNALRTIPAGTTLSYGALARRIGAAAAVRAVGLANGRNPIGVVVPCHRRHRQRRFVDRLWRRLAAQALAAGARSPPCGLSTGDAGMSVGDSGRAASFRRLHEKGEILVLVSAITGRRVLPRRRLGRARGRKLGLQRHQRAHAR